MTRMLTGYNKVPPSGNPCDDCPIGFEGDSEGKTFPESTFCTDCKSRPQPPTLAGWAVTKALQDIERLRRL